MRAAAIVPDTWVVFAGDGVLRDNLRSSPNLSESRNVCVPSWDS